MIPVASFEQKSVIQDMPSSYCWEIVQHTQDKEESLKLQVLNAAILQETALGSH